MQNQQFHHFGYLVHGDGVMVIAAKVAWHLKIISLLYIYIKLSYRKPPGRKGRQLFFYTYLW